jgi:hypothetical protein
LPDQFQIDSKANKREGLWSWIKMIGQFFENVDENNQEEEKKQ